MSDHNSPHRPNPHLHRSPTPPPHVPPNPYQQQYPQQPPYNQYQQQNSPPLPAPFPSISPPTYSSVPIPSIETAVPAAGPTIGPDGRPTHNDEYDSTYPPTPTDYGGPGDQPPPAYTETYGELDIRQDGMSTHAQLSEDGRINININQKSGHISKLLGPAIRTQLHLAEKAARSVPATTTTTGPVHFGVPEFARDVPPLNILIQIIGSRGDVQPFIALGQVLRDQYGHRVRVATHPTFKKFVVENGLEFFSIGGDPAELMAFMVKNPGLMPGMESLRSGDVSKRRRGMWEILLGGWKACIEPGDGTPEGGGHAPGNAPFIADAIIANPPSFGHVHCAEKLGIPLHLMFTMPWSPTTAFPHPLANIQSSNAESGVTNYLSYVLVDMMTWQGLGDLVNRFRETKLALDPISTMWAPGMISRLQVPHTYIWSPTLIPKPLDWPNQISISGFAFLSLASSYSPPPDLAEFLASGPPPVYIGFGSIVVDDPNGLTNLLFTAIRTLKIRALVSQGWGGLGGADLELPPNTMLLGNCPHDWLFPRCMAVVHHGGAGTTAAGIRCGKPTVIVPFFGDQPFWGSMVSKAGAGPEPTPFKKLTAEILVESITMALSEAVGVRARELGERIRHESGAEAGAKTFLAGLAGSGGEGGLYRCILDPSRSAVWRIRKNDAPLSSFAAALLVSNGLIEGGWSGLKLCRHKEWQTEVGPYEPLTGAAGALLGTIGSIMMGVGDFPREVFRGTRKGVDSPGGESSLQGEKGHMSSASLESGSSTAKSFGDLPQQKEKGMLGRSEPLESGNGNGNESGGGFNLQTAFSASKGVSRIVEAGLKSPMDFTLSLAQGFHNAPRLYGDSTVRDVDRITGFHSGIKAAGKELGLGFYDGVSGLVTQPIRGAKEEGAVGFVKGFGKGVGGVFLKGGAAIWGLPGYTMKGIYREIQKLQVSDSDKRILATRIAISEAELHHSSLSVQKAALAKWSVVRIESKKVFGGSFTKGKGKEKERTKTPTSSNPSASSPSSPPPHTHTPITNEKTNLTIYAPTPIAPPSYTPGVLQQVASYDADELEAAIQESVRQTSRGDPEFDAAIEAAMRASLAEMRNNPLPPPEDEEEAFQHAIRASMADSGHFDANAYAGQVGVPEYGGYTAGGPVGPSGGWEAHSNHHGYGNNPAYGQSAYGQPAYGQSAYNHPAEGGTGAWRNSPAPTEKPAPPPRTPTEEYDPDLALALKASLVERGGPILQDEAEFERALRESEALAAAQNTNHHPNTDAELQRALKESQAQGNQDEDLLKAIAESCRLNDEKEAKRLAEEKIVMDYVLRASLEEREYEDRRRVGY